MPDPTQVLLDEAARVQADGTLEGQSNGARLLIDALGLNDPRYIRFRRHWIRIAALAEENDPDLYRALLSYPDDLPNLSRLRPPGGNSRREGIAQSHLARRERGELAETY